MRHWNKDGGNVRVEFIPKRPFTQWVFLIFDGAGPETIGPTPSKSLSGPFSILTNRRSRCRMEPLEKGDRMNTNGPKHRADRIPVAARIIGVTLCEP